MFMYKIQPADKDRPDSARTKVTIIEEFINPQEAMNFVVRHLIPAPPFVRSSVPLSAMEELLRSVGTKDKIGAIKQVRKLCDLSLLESKNLVERFWPYDH